MHPEHSYEVESDDYQHDDETANVTSTVQLFCQQANKQQPQDSIAENFDISEDEQQQIDDIQGKETFQEQLETTEAQVKVGAMPSEDAHFEELTPHQEFNCYEEVNSSEAFNHSEKETPSIEQNHNEEVNPGEEYECHTASFEGTTLGNQEHCDEVHG